MTPIEQSILTKKEHELALGRARAKAFYERNKAAIVKKRQESRKEAGDQIKQIQMAQLERVEFAANDEEEDEEEEITPPKKKLRKTKKIEYTLTECENLLKTDPVITNKHTLSTYLSSIRRIFARIGTKSLKAGLQNVPLMLKKLTKIEKGNETRTQKNTFQLLTIFMTRYGLLDVFKDKATGLAVQANIIKGFNVLKYDSHEITVTDMEKDVPSFNTYLANCKEHFGENSMQYLLSFCYSLFTPRDNFAQMKIIKTLGGDDGEHNFILIKGNKVTFILNQYKTQALYSKIVFEVNDKILNKLLAKYMERNHLGYGSYLFGLAEHLSPFIVKMHKDLGYTGIHKNLFRHIRVEDSFSGENKTTKERIQLANDMQHSFMTSKNYRRNIRMVAQREIK